MGNNTAISLGLPSLQTPVVDKDGTINQTWYKFFYNFANSVLAGAATNDLSGTWPNINVIGINNSKLGATTPTSGNLLVGNGIQWNSVPLSGPVTLANSGLTTITPTGVGATTYGSSVNVPQITVNTAGQITGASNIAISGTTPGGTAGGDLSGTYPNPTVLNINGNPLGATSPILNNFLVGNGSNWSSTPLTGSLLPLPTASTLGGIESYAAVSHQWINSISTSGVPSSSQPADSDISFTDITTGNVSTSAHGFAPKAPNDATKYLDGSGAYSVPAGSGAGNWLKVSQTVTSNSASVVFSSLTTNVAYAVVMSNVIPASSAVNFLLTFNSIASGYEYVMMQMANAANTVTNAASGTSIPLNGSTAGATLSNAAPGWSGILYLYAPNVAQNQMVTWDAVYWNSGGPRIAKANGGGFNSGTTAVTSMTFAMSTGNITSGTFTLYKLT